MLNYLRIFLQQIFHNYHSTPFSHQCKIVTPWKLQCSFQMHSRKRIPYLHTCRDVVLQHIPHKYSMQNLLSTFVCITLPDMYDQVPMGVQYVPQNLKVSLHRYILVEINRHVRAGRVNDAQLQASTSHDQLRGCSSKD